MSLEEKIQLVLTKLDKLEDNSENKLDDFKIKVNTKADSCS